MCESGKPSFFLTWEWVENWIKTLPENIPVFLMVLTGENIPKTAFFVGAPSTNIAHFFLKKLYLNTTGIPAFDEIYIEYNKMLVEGNCPAPLEAVLTRLPLDWDEFVMPALEAHFFFNNEFENAALAYNTIVQRVQSPYVDLEKVRENDLNFLGLLSGNTRGQIRRSYRLYQQKESLVLQVASTVEQAMDILTELISLHQDSWQRRGKPGCFSNDYFTKFHERFVRHFFRAGKVQLARFYCGDSTIGCVYNFIDNGKIYFYQSGIAAVTNKKCKPGLMLHCEIIKHNAKNNYRSYDFLAGSSQYKKSLSTDNNELIWLKLQKKKNRVHLYNYAKYIHKKIKKNL